MYWGKGGCQCVGGTSCRHAHEHTCMLNMINMDASMRAAICNFYTCACVHVHACTCMCTCVGTPPHAPRFPQPSAPSPSATGSPKHQNSISPELIEIIRFCLKILYLSTLLNLYRLQMVTTDAPTQLPYPQSQGKPNQKNYNKS